MVLPCGRGSFQIQAARAGSGRIAKALVKRSRRAVDIGSLDIGF
jgi:hypothetical protein